MNNDPQMTDDFSKIMAAITTEDPYEFGTWNRYMENPLRADPFRYFNDGVRRHVLQKRPDASDGEVRLVQRLALIAGNPLTAEAAMLHEFPDGVPKAQMWAVELVRELIPPGPPIPLAEK